MKTMLSNLLVLSLLTPVLSPTSNRTSTIVCVLKLPSSPPMNSTVLFRLITSKTWTCVWFWLVFWMGLNSMNLKRDTGLLLSLVMVIYSVIQLVLLLTMVCFSLRQRRKVLTLSSSAPNVRFQSSSFRTLPALWSARKSKVKVSPNTAPN